MTFQSWGAYASSFVLVIALIFLLRSAIAYLQPRLSRRGKTSQLSLEETLVLDPKRRLTLFRCGERTGLMLTGGATDIFMGWVDPKTSPDATQSAVAPFSTNQEPER
ncbi:flagellar biosynthetic protein FliO [Asaia astilbis]